MAEIDLGMNLYDFNKQAMAQLPPLDEEEFSNKLTQLVQNVYTKVTMSQRFYWMLLNNERKDYTIFMPITEKGFLSELKETLQNRGYILSIDQLEDGNYEIWIRDFDTNENFCYYFFDYTIGVIKA